MTHNPNAKSYQTTMDRYGRTLEKFLASDDYPNAIIDYLCHDSNWHYRNQTLKVMLFPGAVWCVPAYCSVAKYGECIVTLYPMHWDMAIIVEELGEEASFEDIIVNNVEQAKALARKMYPAQEAFLKEQARKRLKYMRERGKLD